MNRERKQNILEKLANKTKILALDLGVGSRLAKTLKPGEFKRLKATQEGLKKGRAARKLPKGSDAQAAKIQEGRLAVGGEKYVRRPQPRSAPPKKQREGRRKVEPIHTKPKPFRGDGGTGSNIGVSNRMAKLTHRQAMKTERLRLKRQGRFARGAKNPLEFRRGRLRGGNLGTPGALRS